MSGQDPLVLQLRSVAGHAARTEARWLREAAGSDAAHLERLITRRLAGEPVDRILGHRGFWSLELIVTPDTLSPRADTETVVEAARDHARDQQLTITPLRILDLGTGTGAILLALLKEFPHATGLGIDVSPSALAVAIRNAQINQLTDRANFQTGNWTKGLDERFDLVVSNPPYIPSGDIDGLDREVRDHDPRIALDGGDDGLDAYRAILADCPRLLAHSGFVVLEAGFGQAKAIGDIATTCGLKLRKTCNDLSGIKRALIFDKI